jgi:hypothetical protein
MTKLLPCPFCGVVPKLEERGVQSWGRGNLHDYAVTYIRCDHCSLDSMSAGDSYWRGNPIGGGEMKTWRTHEEATKLATEKAVRIWNTRAAPTTEAPPAASEPTDIPSPFLPSDWVMSVAGVIVKVDEWQPGAEKARKFFRKRKSLATPAAAQAPAQADAGEPVAYSVGNTLHWHEGRGVSNAQLYAHAQPAQVPSVDAELLAELRKCVSLIVGEVPASAIAAIAKAATQGTTKGAA